MLTACGSCRGGHPVRSRASPCGRTGALSPAAPARRISQLFLNIAFFVWCVFCGVGFAVSGDCFAAGVEDWQIIKSDHFILYYGSPDRTFPDRVIREAESHYGEITNALGFSRRSEFWLWEKRCRIYLYGTKEEYHVQTGQKTWSGGFSVPGARKIVSYQGSDELIASILPHELAHLIFRDFLGVEKGKIPLWIDEGLAMAQEKTKRSSLDELVRSAAAQKKWIPFQVISKIYSAHKMSAEEAGLFYAQSQSMVRFLLASNPSRFTGFCRNLRDGASLEEALRKNYPKDIPDMNVFEEKWAAHAAGA